MARLVSLYWFRQDLRLADNPALTAAAEAGAVLPVYILDDGHAGDPVAASAPDAVGAAWKSGSCLEVVSR